MGKISPVSAKYIVNSSISIEGVVDKPDVIGAIFGQTEGLLGADLELRELQRSGRIGRIEVKLDVKGGKADGEIIIPSSLDKAETAIIAAALETIQRIGPCNSKVRVLNIEDVRVSKRDFVIERAKELLKELQEKVLPDSQEMAELVANSVRVMEVVEYGRDRLAAGPAIEESEEIILVEGRADVLNLLKNGIKNAIALDGTRIPDTIKELTKRKTATLFVDGDRGGDLIIKGLLDAGLEVDFVCKAPDGKEVEEITKKEIHKALRSKVAMEQVKMEVAKEGNGDRLRRPQILQPAQVQQGYRRENYNQERQNYDRPYERQERRKLSPEVAGNYKEMIENLVGTKGAYILDDHFKILGKVPTSELLSTIKEIKSGVNAIVFDGLIDRDIVMTAERANVKCLVGMSSKINPRDTKLDLLTINDFN